MYFVQLLQRITVASPGGVSNALRKYLYLAWASCVREARKKIEEMPAINRHKRLHCPYLPAHANRYCESD